MTAASASQRAVEPAMSVMHNVSSLTGKPSSLYWSSVSVPGFVLQDKNSNFQLSDARSLGAADAEGPEL